MAGVAVRLAGGDRFTRRVVAAVWVSVPLVPVIVSDTAGLRHTDGAVEREGIRRAVARARDAQLVLWLMDASDPQPDPPQDLVGHTGEMLRVLNKNDLATPERLTSPPGSDWFQLSLATGEGLAALVSAIEAQAQARIGTTSQAPVITQARHRDF